MACGKAPLPSVMSDVALFENFDGKQGTSCGKKVAVPKKVANGKKKGKADMNDLKSEVEMVSIHYSLVQYM